ncbi:hypothetical protein [Methylobacterium sp. CM6247]
MEVQISRQTQFIAITPYPGATQVVCYADTWVKKLVQRVPIETPTIVQATLSTPTAVVAGTTNQDYIAFVSASHSSGSGSPFVVFVDPQANPLAAVASVGHRKDFKDLQQHELLWSPDLQLVGVKK